MWRFHALHPAREEVGYNLHMTQTLDLTAPICCPKCAKEMEASEASSEPEDLRNALTSIPYRIKLSCVCGQVLFVKKINGQQIGELYWPQE